MKTRIIGAVLALLLAVVGAGFLIVYVRGADARAQTGAELTEVYVVKKEIPRGTAGDEIKDFVATDTVPKRNEVPGAVTDLADLAGTVASADLLPGEQLSSARFVSAEDLAATGDIPVPEGMQLLSFSLPSERVVGGQVRAGDRIGLLGTVDPHEDSGEQKINPVTKFAFHGVLVTRVQGVVAASKDAAQGSTPDQESGAAIMLTIALSAEDAERWVWFSEGQEGNYAHMWLTLENDRTDNSGAAGVTAGNAW